MKKTFLAAFVACLLISMACSLPFSLGSSSSVDSGSVELFPQLQDFFDGSSAESATPTPIPADRLKTAHQALFVGANENAIQLYQETFEQTPEEQLKAQALFGLGKSQFNARQYASAIDTFNRILGQYPDSDIVPVAYFMLGQAYDLVEEFTQAAMAYQKYIDLSPAVLTEFARTLQGDTAMKAGDYTQAIFAYQAALQFEPSANSAALNIKIGQAYDGLQDYTTAIQYYLNVYNSSLDDYSRATANLLMGQAYLNLGMSKEAYDRFLDSVYQFPRAYDSFTALSILVNEGVAVDDYVRGLVDYYAGSYDYAIQAFERYLASDPAGNDGSAYYFKGLSHYFRNEPRNAIAEYEILVRDFPGSPYWSAAWDEKAYVQWTQLGEYTNAANTYLSFVSNAPTSPDAPTFLFEAARVFERNDDLENAAQTWLRLMDEYPASDLSYRGLFLAGISYFRSAEYELAQQVFQRVLVLGTIPSEKAKAYLWIGKCFQALGDAQSSREALTLAQQTDPTDYYGARAGEILNGKGVFELEQNYDFGYDLDFERPEAEAWLRTTFLIPAETDLNELADLAGNARITRLQAFWQLNLFSKAINEAELLRAELQGDVVNLYRLMNYLLDLHLYQPAIYACRNILDLAGLDDLESLSIPVFFTHVRFGAYFRELLVPSAIDYNINPLLFYALIRQESMFNPYISSAAGASGLAQIMPGTGKENADLLKWPADYETSDLLRAEVSLELGAFYLRRMQDYLSGNLQAALAAYNAGAGNAEEWVRLSNGDPDLFLEIIRIQETQEYLMQITEFLNVYQLVYSRPQ